MKSIKPIVFCAIILGVLSATQMNAFSRGHGRPVHPEPPITKQNDQQSKEVSCYDNPGQPGCK
ncbi:MAG: hypothetical protein K2X28_01175 [Alphaproteobacteria bacterium]|nr:hypothetical protein [Alphaproteobacteria bacterium]